MAHYGGAELAASFRTVRASTIRIAEEFPAEKYEFSPAPGSRSIGRTLVHVAVAPGAQLYIHSNRFDDLKDVDFSSFLDDPSEPFLTERVVMPGLEPTTKSLFELLLAPKEHEMHHADSPW